MALASCKNWPSRITALLALVGMNTSEVLLNDDAPIFGQRRTRGTVPHDYGRIKSYAVIRRGVVSRLEIKTVSLEGI